jgi:Ca2+-binding RTX toxin-like protein
MRTIGLTAAAAVAAAALAAVGAGVATGGPGKPLGTAKLDHGVLTVSGTSNDDHIAIRLGAGGTTVAVDVNDDGTNDFSFPRANVASIVVNGGSGDDVLRIDETFGVFTDTIPTTLDGGAGDDTLTGGSGGETLVGGAGNDTIDGNRGSDVADMGSGNDMFVWDPGDGSDTIEGRSGTDTLQFNGANVAEHIDLSANGPRLRFFRDIGNVTEDTDGVEQVDFAARGGADVVNVNDLSGTDVDQVTVDEGGPDGAADQVVVNGTAAADDVTITGDATSETATGLAVPVTMLNPDGGDALVAKGFDASDRVELDGTAADDTIGLVGDATAVTATGIGPGLASVAGTVAGEEVDVEGLGGNDTIDASQQQAQPATLVLDGGAGDDTIRGSQGPDTILGGDGNDSVDGGRGTDTALLGAGDDTFAWNPGDGSDTIEGQNGTDTLQFNGANIAERIDLSANGNRLRFTRDIANVTEDAHGVENVVFTARGGADTVTVNDLSGTDVDHVTVDEGTPDGATDHVIVNGTAGNDVVHVAGNSDEVDVTGLAADVSILTPEATDALTVAGLGGDDAIVASGLTTPSMALTLDGGAGNDVLVGGDGDDTLLGGAGDDVLTGGPGLDTLDGGTGNNTLIQ